MTRPLIDRLWRWRYLAWFDVHRARFWQMVAASLLMAGVTFAVLVIVLAPFT